MITPCAHCFGLTETAVSCEFCRGAICDVACGRKGAPACCWKLPGGAVCGKLWGCFYQYDFRYTKCVTCKQLFCASHGTSQCGCEAQAPTKSSAQHNTVTKPRRPLRHARYNQMYFVKGWDPEQHPVLEAKRGSLNRRGQFQESPNFAVPPRGQSGWLIRTYQNAQTRKRRLHWKFVPETQYQRPCIKDRFTDEHLATADKFARNCSMVHYMSQHPRPDRHVVALDTPALQTTRFLQQAGMKNITVANPDPRFREHSTRDVPSTPLFNGTLMEFLRSRHGPERYDVLADYCCTFQGDSHNNCPQDDLAELFGRQLLALNNGLLWLTFSTRGCAQDKAMQSVQSFVRITAQASGYTLQLLESGFYNRRRLLYLFYRSIGTQ